MSYLSVSFSNCAPFDLMEELIILTSLSFEGAIEFFVGLLLLGGGTGIDEMLVSFSEYCSRFKFNSVFILSMVLFVIKLAKEGIFLLMKFFRWIL